MAAPTDLATVCQQLQADRATPAPLRDVAADTLRWLRTPPIVGIVGRVSSGKSTLVNALLGRKVAPTAAQDCTRFVTVYRFGAPEAAEAVDVEGARRPVRLDLSDVSAADSSIHHLDVRLQSAALQSLTVVDTPGVQGTEIEAGPMVRDSLARADIIVHLFRGEIRHDDAALAAEFGGSTDETTMTRSRVVGVLAHADNYGEGGWASEDSIDLARAEAADLTRRYRTRFSEVIALSALMAETTATGQFTEADARVVQAVARLDPALLPFIDQVGAEGVEPEQLAATLAKIGPYGINHARAHCDSSGSIIEFLAARSGLPRLREVLTVTLFGLARARKVAEAIHRLDSTARGTRLPEPLQRLLADAWRGPVGHLVEELTAYRLLVAEYPRSGLVKDLEMLLGQATRADRLRALEAARGEPITPQALAAQARHYQGVASTSRRGVEARAARALSMSWHYLGHG